MIERREFDRDLTSFKQETDMSQRLPEHHRSRTRKKFCKHFKDKSALMMHFYHVTNKTTP